MTAPIVYVSGLYSGPNPSPGLGTARALREAFPGAAIIGVDYSNRSTGLHWTDFSDIWLQRPWNELDLDEYRRQIQDILSSGAAWISGLDLEAHWLSRSFGDHPHVLVPSPRSLERTKKPAVEAAAPLPVRIPTFLVTDAPAPELHAFCREHGQVWLKSPYYEALRVRSWSDVSAHSSRLSGTWSTEKLFIQAHVRGYEESICISAYRGTLLDSVYMTKREVTVEGKTWSGVISPVEPEILDPLREVVRELQWTGGAELEMIRDFRGVRWLIEWNPRFPAWIYAAAIGGHNLPATLLQRCLELPAFESKRRSSEFVRVVLEIPARGGYPLPAAPEPGVHSDNVGGKHPSGMPLLAGRLHPLVSGEGEAPASAERLDPTSDLWSELAEIDFDAMETPRWLLLERLASRAFADAEALQRRFSDESFRFDVAYSIKTNPEPRLLKLAARHGLMAEAISQPEVDLALANSIPEPRVVLNGPAKWWPRRVARCSPLAAIFCDSLEEMREVIAWLPSGGRASGVLGVRIRPPGITSRFGIAVDEPDAFRELVRLFTAIPLEYEAGVHFHFASAVIGVERWWALIGAMVRWVTAIERAASRPITCLDIGGGFHPDDWADAFAARVATEIHGIRRALPGLRRMIVEPGKALTQSSGLVAARVLEVRRRGGAATEIVVDASIAELPDVVTHPHRLLLRSDEENLWHELGRGGGRALGRLCMEHDVLAVNIGLPQSIKPSDIILFLDAGAYDRSMAYTFGRG